MKERSFFMKDAKLEGLLNTEEEQQQAAAAAAARLS